MFFCLVIPNSKSFTAIYYQTAYVFVVNKMKMYLWKIQSYISAKTTFAEQSDLCFSRRRQSRRDLEDYFERSPPTSPSRLDIFSGAFSSRPQIWLSMRNPLTLVGILIDPKRRSSGSEIAIIIPKADPLSAKAHSGVEIRFLSDCAIILR